MCHFPSVAPEQQLDDKGTPSRRWVDANGREQRRPDRCVHLVWIFRFSEAELVLTALCADVAGRQGLLQDVRSFKP